VLGGCGFFGKRDLELSYEVVVRADSPEVRVQVEVSHVNSGSLVLKTYESAKFIGLADLQVSSAKGEVLPYQAEEREGTTIYKVDTKGQEHFQVSYRVKPGLPIGGGHGKSPGAVNGYLGQDFGLLSGRNLFLVPEAPLGRVSVRIEAPSGWNVATAWPQVSDDDRTLFQPRIYDTKGPEDLVNGAVGLGALVSYEKEVRGAPVQVFMYAKWPEEERRTLAEKSFALYAYITDVFAAPVEDPYTLIFTPRTAEGLEIRTFSMGHGQGRPMGPATPSRWIGVAEEMAYRWLRHLPHRMEFKKVEDMWFVDGAAVFYALKACQAVGIIADLEPYWIELYRDYNRNRLGNFKLGNTPAQLYHFQGVDRYHQLRHTGAVLVHYLDEQIRNQSSGQVDLQRVMEYGYEQYHNLDLRNLIPKAASIDIEGVFSEYISPNSIPERPLLFAGKPLSGTDNVDLPEKRPYTALKDSITLLLTGRTKNFLEACGCKANQSGGITRRATLIKQVSQRRQHVAVLDAGNLFPQEKEVPSMDDLSSAEVDTYLEALHRMGYSFSVVTTNELYYGREFLKAKLHSSPLPLISANIYHRGAPIASPTYSLRVGPYRIGFIGIMQPVMSIDPVRFEDHTQDIEIIDPLEAIRTHLPELRAHNNFVGIIGEMHTELVHMIVETFPDLDIVITSGHFHRLIKILREGEVVQAQDAMYGFLRNTLVLYAMGDMYGLNQVDIGIDEKGRFVSFGGSFLEAYDSMREDSEMRNLLEKFYSQVATQASLLSGQVKPLFTWDPMLEGKEYVGTEHCATCHTPQHLQWRSTAHSTAYATLLGVHRHHYPKCVVCHVAGLGRPSGFDVLSPNRDLANVQCEICHGPGSLHIQRPIKETIRRLASKQICLECHNTDHDEDFEYERDYQLVRH
jgi:2',3'-cyclic-nucleotide 2'-phosphodiesterase (5'-nucleotidase family)